MIYRREPSEASGGGASCPGKRGRRAFIGSQQGRLSRPDILDRSGLMLL